MPKLAYLIAKHLEWALDPASRKGIGSSTGPSGEGGSDSDGLKGTWPYAVGERFKAYIAHVDPGGGYVLAASSERKPAMLHVSRMGRTTASLLAQGQVKPGDSLMVEVAEIDQQRNQVQLRQVGDELSETEDDAPGYREARLMADWAAIERAIAKAEGSVKPSSDNEGASLRTWWNLYRPEIAVIRDVRNRVAHGESVAEAELATALDYAEEVAAQLQGLGLGELRI